VVVAGTHGRLEGAHGGADNRTLYDEVVRVPLVVRAPERPLVPVVSAQVRLMDVAPTLLVAAGLPPLDESEGMGLADYGTGLRKVTMWTTIVGRDLDGSPLLGLRNNGIKYVVHADGREELYDASTDPGELRELGEAQPETLRQARDLLVPDQAAFRRLRGR
jgi:arylsulfatase A-like enzyme